MDSQSESTSIHRFAWAVLAVGGIMLVSAIAWKWHSGQVTSDGEKQDHKGIVVRNAPAAVAVQPMSPATYTVQPMQGAPLSPGLAQAPVSPAVVPDVLAQDPQVLWRQSQMLREQAAAANVSETTAGQPGDVMTEERIRELERRQLILQ
jgi:hypothetical protein